MKALAKSTRHREAFTIVELLTVMSIIVILIGLLLPALSKVKRYATTVKEKAQLHSIDAAIELFSNEWGGYPPSDALDSASLPYCGAMKLAEAIVGQDLLGFHSNSVFRRDGMDATNTFQLYPPNIDAMAPALRESNLRARRGPYLQAENANAYRLESIYGPANVAPFLAKTIVLCDVFERQMASGEKTGMPILYYKADTANNLHDPNSLPTPTDHMGNIYSYWDNNVLVGLGKPWESTGTKTQHSLSDPQRFYKNTRSYQILTASRPYRPDTYILLSAGWDNEYGTADDIFNFDWKYQQ
jgi:type II secretory pathway pseudopilin PulG